MENFLYIFQLGYNGFTGKSYAEDSSCTPRPDLNSGWVDGIKNFWNILMNWSCLACPFPQSPTDNTCP